MVENEIPPNGFTRSVPPVRITDVAHRAGVSLATASRSINGAPGVSAALAARVTAAADELGYLAALHARAPSAPGSSIGLIVGDLTDPSFAVLAGAIIAAAKDANRVVQVVQAEDPAGVVGQIRLLRQAGVSTLVLATDAQSNTEADAASDVELESFQLSRGRVVLVGRHGVTADSVAVDDRAAGRDLAEHLRSLGHRSIGIVAGPAELRAVSDRLAGICEVFNQPGLSTTVTHQRSSRDGGASGTASLLATNSGITAIIAVSDSLAIGVLAALRQRGVSVPTEISVAGFDDLPIAADLVPALTTVRRQVTALASEVIRFALLEPGIRPRLTLVPHELVVRDSTGIAQVARRQPD